MADYATVAQLRAYADLVGGDDADLEKVLERAEKQIDALLGPWVAQANGLKLGDPAAGNPLDLTPDEIAALADAVCAQAEYRVAMGEPFFVQAQLESVSGPDFSTRGKRPYIGPKVRAELDRIAHLRITTATAV